MDTSVNRFLETGLAFILFIVGISAFIVMQEGVMSMTVETRKVTAKETQVNMIEGTATEPLFTIADLYILLTDESLSDRSNWLGDTGYLSSSEAVGIYIDGVPFPAVTDYKGRQNLKASLLTLNHTRFEKDYHVNQEGLITEIHFIGR